ncbi:c-type cytochrome [Bordetella tumulicola]|uniref:c-type cytochrome n=1 Tax=Bordetella tumulicola TaxID=1649133 RepID=UPI0039EFA9F3
MKRVILYVLLALVVACVVALGVVYWLGTRDEAVPAAAGNPVQVSGAVQTEGLIEQGRYLARLGNCMGCHTAQGGQAYAGGTPIPTPFGTLYGPNITSDVQAGIGDWDADDFWHALHNGKSKDGSLLYPAFPYTEYTRVSRADSDALFAFLRTVPPSSQPSRAHELKFPYDQRELLAFWRALYFEPGVLQPEAGQSTQWNRGRYLVEGLGHCAACHAPRNSHGATRAADGLAGGMIAGLGWYAPSLANDPVRGLGKWSAQDIATLLRTGVATHSTASGPMAEVVLGSSQYLTETDALAMGQYLKSLPASSTDSENTVTQPSTALLNHGGKLYAQHCAQCHQDQGQGSGVAWPALAGNPTVTAPSPVNAIRLVLDGAYAPATAANPRPHGMPPFGQVLGDNDIAALVSYIRFSWDNRASAVTGFDVKRVRDASTLN